MKKKKSIIFAVVVFLLVLVGAIGASYAYFAATNETSGNDQILEYNSLEIGNIKWEGTKVFTSSDLLPGEIGIQTFTIEKTGDGEWPPFMVDLNGTVDEAFKNDIMVSMYVSDDPTTNNVEIVEGEKMGYEPRPVSNKVRIIDDSSIADMSDDYDKEIIYKEDTLKINGKPRRIYGPKPLSNKVESLLGEFFMSKNAGVGKTTCYVVYYYINKDNQNSQQGKSFSGDINVRLASLEEYANITNKYGYNIFDDSESNYANGKKLTDYLTEIAYYNYPRLLLDDYGNLRYFGYDPDNYISVDGELWRIIGVMKDIDDGTGKKEDRVKLIRANSVDNRPWDLSESSINKGSGVNEWSQADLMKLLNPGYENVNGSLYWNSESGTCYADSGIKASSCDYTSSGMKDGMKALIGDAVWNTGAIVDPYDDFVDLKLYKFYELERSTNIGKLNWIIGDYSNDTVERTTAWTGKVGLMYPSDFGYAMQDSESVDVVSCRKYGLYSRNNACMQNNWLQIATLSWTMTPAADKSHSNLVFVAPTTHYPFDAEFATGNYGILPVVYLKSDVKIVSGNGWESDPYILSGN